MGKDIREVLQQSLGGALIVLPTSIEDMSAGDEGSFREIEAELLEGSFGTPVYLVLSTPEIRAMLRSLEGTQKSQQQSALSGFSIS